MAVTSWHLRIPAHAGMHRPITPTPEKILCHSRKGGNPSHNLSFPQRQESTPSSVIPAKAGIHNSRACGNSTKRNTIQTNQTHHSHTELPSTPFPQRQESIPSSVIPAKAGIHNSRACGNSSSHYPNTRKDGVESRKYAILGLSSTCHSPNISQTNST